MESLAAPAIVGIFVILLIFLIAKSFKIIVRLAMFCLMLVGIWGVHYFFTRG